MDASADMRNILFWFFGFSIERYGRCPSAPCRLDEHKTLFESIRKETRMIELAIISAMFFAAGFGWGWILRRKWQVWRFRKEMKEGDPLAGSWKKSRAEQALEDHRDAMILVLGIKTKDKNETDRV